MELSSDGEVVSVKYLASAEDSSSLEREITNLQGSRL